MPEIVEAQVMVDGLRKFIGDVILDVIPLSESKILVDQDKFIEQVRNKRIINVVRYVKRPVIILEDDLVLDVFLSMTGSFIHGLPHRHARVKFLLANWNDLYYVDMRKWGRIRVMSKDEHWQRVISNPGLDTLESSVDDMLYKIDKAHDENRDDSSYTVKDLLMDDRYLLGLGNIYAQEIAYDAGLLPHRSVGTLSVRDRVILAECIRKHLDLAYALGGLSVANYIHVDGELGKASELNHVYRRTHCKKCNSPVHRIEQSGRSSYYCTTCQK